MRKIEEQMTNAITAKSNFSSANTRVIYRPELDASNVFLHGNHIATVKHMGNNIRSVRVNVETLSAWPTPTTCSRLRALGVSVNIRKGEPMLDGKPLEI